MHLEPTASNQKNIASPALSSYTDFRLYLKDFYNYQRETNSSRIRAYSYATFSAAADIKSPNYLKLIIDGHRNLSDAMITKFARALQLNKEGEAEFRALVNYGQAKEPLERNRCLKELADIRVDQRLKAGEINKEIMEKVPGWLTWVLYALVDQKDVQFDSRSLREHLRRRVSTDEVDKALTSLIDNGELVEEEGKIAKGRKLMEGAQDVPPDLVRKLQAELIYLGMESLFQDKPQDREFGAFTMALTKEEFEQVKFEVRQLRKKLYNEFSIKRETEPGDRVYQLNVQLFPVTE